MPRETKEWFFKINLDLATMTDELTVATPKIARGKHWEPRVDVFEDAEQFILRADLAGVKAEDIGLSYDPESHSLVIRGERLPDDLNDRPMKALQLEIFYGDYTRAIRLPAVEIEPDAIKGQYRSGFLTVWIPKRREI